MPQQFGEPQGPRPLSRSYARRSQLVLSNDMRPERPRASCTECGSERRSARRQSRKRIGFTALAGSQSRTPTSCRTAIPMRAAVSTAMTQVAISSRRLDRVDCAISRLSSSISARLAGEPVYVLIACSATSSRSRSRRRSASVPARRDSTSALGRLRDGALSRRSGPVRRAWCPRARLGAVARAGRERHDPPDVALRKSLELD